VAEKLGGFLGRGLLTGFRNAFRTGGGPQIPSQIDLDAPIQPVVDTSRYADRGIPWTTSVAVAHAIADTQRDTFQARVSLANLEPAINPDLVDVWLMRPPTCLLDTATAAAFNEAAAALTPSGTPPSLPTDDRTQLLTVWEGVAIGEEIVVGDGRPALASADVGGSGAIPYGTEVVYPVLIRPDSDTAGLAFVSVSTGILTFVRWPVSLWITPRGCTPPGMA